MNDPSPDESQSGSEDGSLADESGEAISPTIEAGSTCDDSLAMTPISGLIVALLAGLVVWGTLEMILPVFQLPDHLRDLTGNVSDAEQQAYFAAIKVNTERNAMVSLVLLSSTLALLLSVTELFHRRAGLRVVWGGLIAALIAGVFAIGAGAVAIGLHDALELQGHRLGKTIIVQGAMLGVIGLGIGVAIAMPMLRLRLVLTCLAGCVIGGVLAALVFPIAASICLPDVNTDALVPQPGIGRLLWAGLATGLIGLAATGLGKKEKKQRATAK